MDFDIKGELTADLDLQGADLTAESQLKIGQQHDTLIRELKEIVDRVQALPINKNQSDDEILGYDEYGLPR